MGVHMNSRALPKHIRIVVLYVVIGGLWFFIIDHFILRFTRDPEWIILIEEYKELTFIAITALLLYIERKRTDKMQRRADKREKKQLEKMAQADKMITLGTLVSGVAHEINNPTNFITLNTPILKEAWQGTRPVLDEHYHAHGDFSVGRFYYSELREWMDQLFDGVSEGAERITRIVASLKDFARPDPSDMNQEADINHVIHEAVTLLKNPIEKHTARFEVQCEQPLPPITGSVQKLEQVLINLIQNSLDSLTDRQQRVRVTSSYDRSHEMILVEVKDEGGGIEPEIMSRIKDPFFTTKRLSGGTGLGLSIASRMVKEHGGTLNISSEPGEGTTATLVLPVQDS